MSNVREKISDTILSFSKVDTALASENLLNVLGYSSKKKAKVDMHDLKLLAKRKDLPSVSYAHWDDWRSAHLIFQLTGDELKSQDGLFDFAVLNEDLIQSYLFFAVELKEYSYSRSKLSAITRFVNRLYPMPVMVLFRYGDTITLSVIDRRLHKRDESKGVLEKVTLIKDINITRPHRAHIEILFDLSLLELIRSRKTIITFLELHKAWQATLNISVLNKKFYREIADWFFWARGIVHYPKIDNAKTEEENHSINLIRLLTRLIFVWFLKEKNLVPEDLFDETKLYSVLNFTDKHKSTYYKAILQNLFFATLNTPMHDEKGRSRRIFRSEGKTGSFQKDDYGISSYFRYKDYFVQPEPALQLFTNIPFLNGGLFDCLDNTTIKPRKRVDCFSDYDRNQLTVPDELFFGKERIIDLSKVFDDLKRKKERVKGLIHILNDYKFTIAENTPVEEEVALDPELLGRVFENLLAAYNPETGITARKATGSFYTPREIVNYMVDESLIAYLKTRMLQENPATQELGIAQTGVFGNEARKGQLKLEHKVEPNQWIGNEDSLENELRKLVAYSDEGIRFTEYEKDVLVDAIHTMKVLDPTCGSGAFPMGVLLKVVHVLHKLDPENRKWKQKQIDAAVQIPDSSIRRETLDSIDEAFSEENNFADYGRKLYLIENCIYGVDIQPIAVQITKLRFFISLLVDQKSNDAKENRGVLSLPNLETKFVAANTLIGIEQRIQETFHNVDVQTMENKLRNVRKSIFSARSYREKKQLQEQDKVLRCQLSGLIQQKIFGMQKLIEKQIATASDNKKVNEKRLKEPNLLPGVWKQHQESIKRIVREIDELQAKLLDSNMIEVNAQRLADWDPYDQNASAPFFDSEWMFGITDGFAVVIGNPPHGADLGDLAVRPSSFGYGNYDSQKNSASFFIENACKLANQHSIISFIIPKSLSFSEGWERTRNFISGKCTLREIVDISEAFENVLLEQVVVSYQNKFSADYLFVCSDGRNENIVQLGRTSSSLIEKLGTIPIYMSENHARIIDQLLSNSVPLGRISKTFRGLPWQRRLSKKGEPIRRGREIQRYGILLPIDCVHLTKDEEMSDVVQRLRQKKIVSQRIVAHVTKPRDRIIVMSFLDDGTLNLDTVENTILTDKNYSYEYVLGFINSTFGAWFYYWFVYNRAVRTMDFDKYYLGKLPIPQATNAGITDVKKLVEKMLDLCRDNPGSSFSPAAQKVYEELDAVIYCLYGLSPDDIQIIEKETYGLQRLT